VPTRAAVYARISSDDDHDALGVKRQQDDCRALAERKGWQVVAVHIDNDISAADKRKDRPGFAALLEQMQAGEVDAIVAGDLDRLVRRPIQLEEFVERCQAAGIRHLATVGGDVDLGTGDGLLVARIKGAVAADEVDRVRKRVKRKKLELAQAGRPSGGGARPFGYEADRVTVREPEAAVIRQAAIRLLAGESMVSLCAELERTGVRTVSGRPWLPNVLRNLLVSPRVAGLRQHQGEVVGEAAWPAILDRRTWEQLRAVILAPDRRRVGAGRRLLTGLLVCGRTKEGGEPCGARLVSGLNNGNRAYICRKAPGFDGCARLAMVAGPLEALIIEAVLRLSDSPDFAEALARRDAPDDDGAAEEITAAQDRLAELAAMWAGGEITRVEWMTARKALEAAVEAAQRRVSRRRPTTALDGLDGAGALRAAWPDLPVSRQRAVLAAIVDRVVIGPARRGYNKFDAGRVDVTWRA
jgi:DNA invertase Pin-like site-specific DNA recombinase